MKCSLNKMRENFPGLPDSNIIDLGGNPQKMEIITWVQEVNNRAKALGFKHRPIFRLDGNKITYNENNNDAYQNFLKEKLYEERVSQEIFNENLGSELIDEEVVFNEVPKPDMSFLFAMPFVNQMNKKEEPLNEDDTVEEQEETFVTGTAHIKRKANFSDWVSKREELLGNLKNTKNKMIRQKVSKDKLIPVNQAIEALEKEVKEFKSNYSDVEMLKANVMLEINSLHDILDYISNDKLDSTIAASIVDTNMLRERMETLEYVFKNKEYSDGSLDPSGVAFQKFLSPEDYTLLAGHHSALEVAYKKSIEKVIEKIILYNDYLVQLQEASFRNAKNKEEQQNVAKKFEEFDKKIQKLLQLRKEAGDNMQGLEGASLKNLNVQSQLLGALSYDSILTEIVAIMRDINSNTEAGITNPWKKQLKNSFKALLDKKATINGKEVPFADKIWIRDEFGNRTNKVINYLDTDHYYNVIIPKIKVAKKDFSMQAADSQGQTKAYSAWMAKLKNEAIFIDIHKTPEFVNKHKNTEDFKEFFTYSQEEMEAYEEEMKALLGPTVYEIEKRKQARFVENFLVDSYKTSSEKFAKNPLRFLEHFNKEDFYKADEESGIMLLPEFAYFIPKDEKSYNKEFRQLAEEGGKDFQEFYEATVELSNYTRDSLVSAGEDIQYLEIPDIVDIAGRAAIEDMSWYGKLGVRLREILKFVFNNDAFFTHREAVGGNADIVQTHYHSFGKKDRQNLYRGLIQQTLPNLLQRAKDLNMTIPAEYDFVEDKSLTGDEKTLQEERIIEAKKALASAIALHTFNRKSSMDTYKRILYGTEIAESYNTRNTTKSLIDLIDVYAQDKDLSEYRAYMETWQNLNITKAGNIVQFKDGKKVYQSKFQEIEAKKITKLNNTPLQGLFKKYGEGEKVMKKFFEEERKNLTENREYHFWYNDKEYYYNPDTDSYHYMEYETSDKGVEHDLTKAQIEDAYNEYLGDKINKLGENMAVGGILNGLSWNMFKNLLFFKMKSGFSNRVQGYNQNNQGAASGLHDFDLEALQNSRKFLSGIGLDKILRYAPVKESWNFGLFRSHKRQQLNTLLYLAQELNLLSNVAQDDMAGDGGQRSASSAFIENMREFTSDFAMNIPEMHNQLELLLSIMQNPKYAIEDIEGNKVPLFNPKTMSFPFDPVTMKLLPKFRTEENIANWENFGTDASGTSAPQNVLLQKYSAVRDKLHGNYRTDDKIPLQKTMTGRALAVFVKWSFENYDNQWGKKEVSIVNASVDVKGRKIILLEKAPVLATHMALNNVGIVKSITTGLSALSIASTGGTGFTGALGFALAGGLGLGTLITTAGVVIPIGVLSYNLYKNRKNLKTSKRDLQLSLNYAKEVALRTAYTTSKTVSRGYYSPVSEKYIKDKTRSQKYLDKYEITEEERALMAESAQELADKYNTYLGFLIANAVTLGLYHLLAALNGDDDDDKERNLELLERYEGALKYLMNIRNNLVSDTEKWTNPISLANQYTTSVLYDWLMNGGTRIKRDLGKYDDGSASGFETFVRVGVDLAGFAGAPRAVTELFDPEDKWFYSSRVYDTDFNTTTDDVFSAIPKSTDENYSQLVKKKRKRVRNILEDKMLDQIREYNKNGGNIPTDDKTVSKNIDNYLRQKGAYKAPYDSDENVYLRVNWDDLENIDSNYTPY